MKKTVRLLLLFVVGALCIAGCGAKQNNGSQKESDEKNRINVIEETNKAIEELNQNSELGCSLLMYFNGGEHSFNPQAPNIFSIEGITEKYSVEGYYFPYPYYSKVKYLEKESRLTQLNIYSNLFHVFGIKVGDDSSTIEAILLERGYSQIKVDSSIDYYESEGKTALMYKKYDIRIQFIVGKNASIIEKIAIGISNEDKDTIVYN